MFINYAQLLDFQYFSKIPLFHILYKCLIFNKITIFHSFWKITLVTVVNRWFSADLQVSFLCRTFASVLWDTKNFRRSRSRSRCYGWAVLVPCTENSSLKILIDGRRVGYFAKTLHYNGIYASNCNIRYNLATGAEIIVALTR